MSSLGERIRERRIELRWTQDTLAEKARISKGFLSDLENNNRSIGADRLLDIAKVLGLSLDFLMKGENVDAISTQVEIPWDLAEFAKREDLPFATTLLLLDVRRQFVAHCSNTKPDASELFAWDKLYESVKKFLPK